MKNIIIVQNSFKTMLNFRKREIIELYQRNVNITLLAVDDCNIKTEDFNVPIELIKIKKNNYIQTIFSFLFKLTKYRFKYKKPFLLCHFIVTYIMIFPSIFLFKNRTILVVEGLGSLFNKERFLILLRFLLRKQRIKVLFTNRSEQNKLSIPKSKVLNGIGIDLDLFNIKKNHYTGKKIKLVYVGRLIKDKGILDAIKVVEQLNLIYPNSVILDVCGDIYESNPSSLTSSEFLKLKKEYNGIVNFLGYITNVNELYYKYDCLINTSKLEGFPVNIMEASASGILSFGYKVPGIKDAICYGVNGFYVNYGDVNKLVEVIKGKITDIKNGKYINTCISYAIKNFSNIEKSKIIVDSLFSLEDE